MKIRFTTLLLLPLLAALAAVAMAQSAANQLPKELREVGIEENLGGQLPLDAVFRDDQGRMVRLGDYFENDKPVVLVLAYYRCPMLCGLVLDGLIDSVKSMKWTAGDEYEIVVVSIDPNEKVKVAQFKKQELVEKYESYGHKNTADGWHLLSGNQQNIDRVTEAVGFKYKYLPSRDEFSHTAAIYITTPEARISRYLYGVKFDPETIRLSMIEAAEGEVGSPLDQLLLFCFHYDPTEGQYTVAAMNVMRAGGILTVLALGGVILMLFMRERARARTVADKSDNHHPAAAH